MNIVSKYFVIRNFYAPYENPYHIFLVLEKDQDTIEITNNPRNSNDDGFIEILCS